VAEAVTTTEPETAPETEPGAAPAELEQAVAADASVDTADTEEGARSFRGRFRVVYVLLGAVVVLAAGALVYLLNQPGTEQRGPFSPWEPQSEAAEDRAQEIANFVAANYRLDADTQLVTVQAAPPRVQDFPLAAVAIGSAPGGATFSGENIPVFPAEETIVYILCGLGQECAIAEGEPSEERQRLLRREALELALYTFRYIDDVDNVVAFMPPRPGFRPSYALFFQRPELEDLVDRPLRDTLPAPVPPLPTEIPPSEAVVIDQLTQPRFFGFQFQQLPNGTVALFLEDPSRVTPEPIETTPAEGEGETETPAPAPEPATSP
jgi:hypothetical protein